MLETLPSATFTPGVDSTFASTDAGIVGACEKSALTAWRDSISTSTPFCVRSKRFLNDSLIVSVKTSVPTTKATPITTAKPVRTDRSLRSAGRAARPWSRQATAFIRSRTPSVVSPAPSWTTLPSLQHHDPVGHRGRRAGRG